VRRRLAHRLKARLTFANVVALLALFLALGGTSFGRDTTTSAVSGVKKALGLSKKADRNSRKALTLARRAERNATAALAKAGPGPSGAAGSPGLTGSAGSAVAYAAVEYCASGDCEDQPSVGWFAPDDEALAVDNTVNFSNPSPGVFCFRNLPPAVHNVTVSMAPSPRTYIMQGRAGTLDDPIGSPCSPSGGVQHNAIVEIRNPASPATLIDPDTADKIFVVFN
jgi:hypothetical protein